MILGLSVHTFTVIHVLISLVGIVAGVIVAFAMVQGKSVPGWTALALLALILTSVTGFFFHDHDVYAGAEASASYRWWCWRSPSSRSISCT